MSWKKFQQPRSMTVNQANKRDAHGNRSLSTGRRQQQCTAKEQCEKKGRTRAKKLVHTLSRTYGAAGICRLEMQNSLCVAVSCSLSAATQGLKSYSEAWFCSFQSTQLWKSASL